MEHFICKGISHEPVEEEVDRKKGIIVYDGVHMLPRALMFSPYW